MDEFLKMDVFFVVTTAAVIALIIIAIYLAWRADRILRSVEHIAKQAAQESDALRLDLAEMRADVRHGAGRAGALIALIRKMLERREKTKR